LEADNDCNDPFNHLIHQRGYAINNLLTEGPFTQHRFQLKTENNYSFL